MSENTFKHSGAMGDIIYSLPAVKALGGGILYLDIEGGLRDPFVQKQTPGKTTRLDQNSYETIRPLMMEQSYISDVRVWTNEEVDFNLDSMRPLLSNSGVATLGSLYLKAFGLDESLADVPWLTLKSPPIKLTKEIIINRTLRYQSKYMIWELKKPLWLSRGIFIGTQDEHRFFEHTFYCKIDYHKTDNALEVAQILAGCRQLVANQSMVMSIAVGLGIPYIQEVYMQVPNCMYKRENAEFF